MRFFSSQRFLAIYSGVLTIVFAVTVLCGFAARAANRSTNSRSTASISSSQMARPA